MPFSPALFSALAVTTLLAQRVLAGGTIACYTSHLAGGVGNIPIHNAEIYDGTDTYISDARVLACPTMVGRQSDGYTNWLGSNGRTISADFWITKDACMNVETGGKHYWCCTNGIKQNDGAVTTCNYRLGYDSCTELWWTAHCVDESEALQLM